MRLRAHRFRPLAAALIAGLIWAMLLPGPASAHERRLVAGKYQLVVGFLNEPAFAGQMNGIDLRVTIPAEGDRPVEGLEKTLRATVIVGGGARTLPVELRPRFRQPGAYAGYFIPTREGSYIFHFTGTIDGAQVDERFESGPGRFDDVKEVQTLQFPDRVPDAVALANDVRAAREEAAVARTLGIAGAVGGALGLLAATLAWATRRRPAPRQALAEELRD